jgi:hypothetical protein
VLLARACTCCLEPSARSYRAGCTVTNRVGSAPSRRRLLSARPPSISPFYQRLARTCWSSVDCCRRATASPIVSVATWPAVAEQCCPSTTLPPSGAATLGCQTFADAATASSSSPPSTIVAYELSKCDQWLLKRTLLHRLTVGGGHLFTATYGPSWSPLLTPRPQHKEREDL